MSQPSLSKLVAIALLAFIAALISPSEASGVPGTFPPPQRPLSSPFRLTFRPPPCLPPSSNPTLLFQSSFLISSGGYCSTCARLYAEKVHFFESVRRCLGILQSLHSLTLLTDFSPLPLAFNTPFRLQSSSYLSSS